VDFAVSPAFELRTETVIMRELPVNSSTEGTFISGQGYFQEVNICIKAVL
jgi:hypothetical protein